jgi:membrane protease YdiL (CAAX protease family)
MATLRTKEIIVFVALAMGLAWLVVLPLWLSPDGLKASYATPLMMAMMWTPALAVAGTWLIFRPEGFSQVLGWRKHNTRIVHLLAALWIPGLVVLVSIGLAALLGLYTLDLENLSGMKAMIDGAAAAGSKNPLADLSLHQLAALSVAGAFFAGIVNVPFALGEELGWRGYLLPRLMPLGQWKAFFISGVIWGAWHAPVILLGYNYPDTPVLGVFLFMIVCILLGTLLGWTRVRTQSVWPATLGHGAVNAGAGLVAVFNLAGTKVDAIWVGITGLTGWITMAVLIGIMIAAGLFSSEKREGAQ